MRLITPRIGTFYVISWDFNSEIVYCEVKVHFVMQHKYNNGIYQHHGCYVGIYCKVILGIVQDSIYLSIYCTWGI